MDESTLLELCDRLIAAARAHGADAAEVAVTWAKQAETALENDDVHTVNTTEEATFGLRVLRNHALGFVTANRLDDATLAATAAEACAQAGVMPKDPWNELPSARTAAAVSGLWDSRITEVGVDATTERAARLLDRVKAFDPRVKVDSGSVSATVYRSAIVSTTGVRFVESATSLDAQLFGMAVDDGTAASFDYDGDSTRSFSDFDDRCDALADHFSAKCLSGIGARAGQSYKGLVLLSPDTVVEFLLPNLCAAIAADAVRKGRSPLGSKLGETVAVSDFTLIDDATVPGGASSSAIDREGYPTARTLLIERGVLISFLFNQYEACAAGDGSTSTGHASGTAASLPGIAPHQLELAAGKMVVDEILKTGSQPLLDVGRFSGSTNPVTGDFSGVAKNSALVGHGSKQPVRETAIAGNLYDLLRNILGVSTERRLVGGTHLVPYLLIDGVSVTAG